MFRIQVHVSDALSDAHQNQEWKDLRPTGGPAYEFATQAEALRTAKMCYPDEFRFEESMRVVRVVECLSVTV